MLVMMVTIAATAQVLHGPATDPATAAAVGEAIASGSGGHFNIVNHRKAPAANII